jgi:hypothetical protein
VQSHWSVITEVAVVRQVEAWDRDARRQLFAVQELLREKGPEVFDLYAEAFTEVSSWDELDQPCHLEFFIQVRGRYLALVLEIRPARTIVVRRAGFG